MVLKSQGQSLSEYGIVFGLVVVVAIASIFIMGSQGNALLTNSNDALFAQQSDGMSRAERLTSSLSSSSAAVPTLTLGDGTVLSLDHYPANIGESINTASAEGTTEKLSLTLKDIGRQLLAEGKITEDEYNIFSATANQGHEMAALQKILEDGLTKGRYFDSKLYYKGEESTPYTLSCYMGFHDYDLCGGSRAVSTSQLSQEVKQAYFGNIYTIPNYIGTLNMGLITEYQKLLNIPYVRDNPNLRHTVASLVVNIDMLARSTAKHVNLAADTDRELGGTGVPANFIREKLASQITDFEAANLCNLSNVTQDTGIHCPRT